MSKIGIVIVNYNGAKYQNDCIKSLYEMDYQDFEIIVVDSASSDNSVALLKAEYPKVHVIECKENVGVAAGNNIGIKYAKEIGTEYTLLMNNDVELDSKLLGLLIERADEETVVVPKIYFYQPNDLLWYAGGELVWNKGTAIHTGMREYDNEVLNSEKYVDYAPTCCMLVHNSVFDRVGYMDEKLFMYFDDTDFCVRLGQHNIKILYLPQAFMWHKVSSSTGGENSKVSMYYISRNQLYYKKKYADKISFKTTLYIHAKAIAKFILSPLRKQHKNDKWIIVAYKDFYQGKMGRKDF